MKCHYEILGLETDCTSADIKKAYRKLALEWHPDKNLHRLNEATETFQLIQQAYEILIDPQERAWYDRHKEDILRGDAEEAFKDNCLNVYQYYNTSCFKGYSDDEKGFYTVYRQVFENIAAEDKPFLEETEFLEIPNFGFSNSSYEEVVHYFYAYWQSYCTAKTYSWVDKFDLSEARRSGIGRPGLREIEKQNKKVRDQHKKLRNDEVRQLVAFVRKRDKRVQAHKKLEEEKKIEKAKAAEELRKQQILERNKSFENYKESEWLATSNLDARYSELENSIDATFGASSDGESDEDAGYSAALYCVACEKDFKTEKAKKNHENSKKHKDNVLALKYLMQEEDEKFFHSETSKESPSEPEKQSVSDSEEDVTSEALLEELIKNSSSKGRKKKRKNKISSQESEQVDVECEDLSSAMDEIKIDEIPHTESTTVTAPSSKTELPKKKDKKNKPTKDKPIVEVPEDGQMEKPVTVCDACHVDFKSRNKLFSHLKESGHASYKTEPLKQKSTKKRKAKNL